MRFDDDKRFSRSGGGGRGKKRKAVERPEEKDIVVRCNGRPESQENTVLVELHKLEDYSLEGLLEHVGKKLYDAPAATLYHEDGIAVAGLALLKEGETLFSVASFDEAYVGCAGVSSPANQPSAAPTAADQVRITETGILNSKDDFIACGEFLGEKKGYFFSNIEGVGLGYHVDQWAPDGSKWGKSEVRRAALSDILAKYGGEEYLGRPSGVHGLYESAPIIRDAAEANFGVASAKSVSRAQARSSTPPPSTSPVPASAAQVEVSVLQRLEAAPEEEAAPVLFKRKEKKAPQQAGLAESEEPKEKKEKMSKRARKRARIREEKSAVTQQVGDEDEDA